MGRRSSSALAKMNSSARAVLPDPGSPMTMLIEFSGMPPSRISSSWRLPVESRLMFSSLMLRSPDTCASRFEKLLHRLDQRVFSEGFQEEGVGSRFAGAAGCRQDAEDHD